MAHRIIPILIIAATTLAIILQAMMLPRVDDGTVFSLVSEGFLALVFLSAVFFCHKLKMPRSIHTILMAGFILLYISFFTDACDELFVFPTWATSVFEDGTQFGLIFLVAGIYKLLNHNDQLYAQLIVRAETDHLTGLLNRRAFLESADKLIDSGSGAPGTFSIIVLDLDRFKEINDEHGHAAGDQVLVQFSILSRDLLGDNGIIGRWGGEEFVFLIREPQAQAALAPELAERLRMAISGMSVESGSQLFSLTASMGVATFNRSSSNLVEAIKEADRALYQAKASGRDKVVLAS